MRPVKINHERHSLHQRAVEIVTTLPYSTLFSLWIVLTAGFAMCYALLATFIPEQAPQALINLPLLDKLGNSLYFSIVTATSTGYGDIVPYGFSKVLSSIQSISALIIFAVFITRLVSQEQEIALKEIHRLTYEDVFHNTREGFFIIRKDIDRILGKVERRESLTPQDWEDLATAYKLGQSLLLEIPDFYDAEDNHLYTIDERREQLLQEAVHRTLHRINQLIDECSIAGVDWTRQKQSVQELEEFLHVVHKITPLWRDRSPYQRHESFENILRLMERVTNRMTAVLP
ncbi:MAG: ion channel [Candidatus Peregrinibacteria bacterium]